MYFLSCCSDSTLFVSNLSIRLSFTALCRVLSKCGSVAALLRAYDENDVVDISLLMKLWAEELRNCGRSVEECTAEEAAL